MALSPGTRLGAYEVVALLGEGGMGQVYRARDPRLGRDVAIKVIATSGPLDRDRLRRFEQEAQAAAALEHPNVIAVHEAGIHDGTPYIVSELLEGATLRERLAAGALPVRKAIETAIQIAQGLAAAHERRIVHRDLKPENVFLTRDGRVKILDFGLAKIASDVAASEVSQLATVEVEGATAPGTVMGTVGYMSPEQVRGEPLDHRTDIFSFGAILYEMVTGRRAFGGRSAADVMTAVLREDPPPMAQEGSVLVPSSLERIVGYCLEKDRAQRLQSAHDVAIALEALTGSRTGAESALHAPEPVRSARWRVPVTAAVAAVCLALAYLAGRSASVPEPLPGFTRVTYQKGTVRGARFGSDRSTVIYSAAWGDAKEQLYTTRVGSPESSAFGPMQVILASVSPTGELAVLRNPSPGPENALARIGTLARMPAAGGAPREVMEGVEAADWTPDGQGLVVVRSVDRRTRVEFPIGTVLVETAGWVDSLRVSPDGSRIAFAEHPLLADDRGWVSIVDVGSKRVERLTDERSSMRGVAWNGARNEVLFGTGSRVEAVSLDRATRIVANGTTSLTLDDVAADGTLLVHFDDIRIETHVLTASGDEKDVTWLDATVPTAFWPDGQRLLFWEGMRYGAYYRDLDGSPAVRLGEGTPMALSPDGKSVLAVQHTEPMRLAVYPTGAGESRLVPTGTVARIFWAHWTPDGRRVVFSGVEPGRGVRVYVASLDGGEPTAVGPEGTSLVRFSADAVSPDGQFVIAAGTAEDFVLVPLGGGPVRPLKGLRAGDRPLGWEADGKTLLVLESTSGRPLHLVHVDVPAGARTMWKTLMPRTGEPPAFTQVMIASRDRQSFAFTVLSSRSTLFTVTLQPQE